MVDLRYTVSLARLPPPPTLHPYTLLEGRLNHDKVSVRKAVVTARAVRSMGNAIGSTKRLHYTTRVFAMGSCHGKVAPIREARWPWNPPSIRFAAVLLQ